ncbi:unnamed protein product [Periconia digitata]|uniref:Uncharacterized protein n=1 Tax=Periconia digitata TaxID=1303443 RepID=A0A9W4UQS1_9PLEO|nr:unnamed protein product [Periconia digitata]
MCTISTQAHNPRFYQGTYNYLQDFTQSQGRLLSKSYRYSDLCIIVSEHLPCPNRTSQ